MDTRKWTIYLPVIVVIVLSVPIVVSSLWPDINRVRNVAEGSEASAGFFSGFAEDTEPAVNFLDPIIDKTVPDTTEKVNYTTPTGQNMTVEQKTPKGTLLSSILNALFMASVAVLAAFGIFLLFKQRKRLTLKMFFTGALGLCSSISLMLYLYLARDMGEDMFGTTIPDGWPFYAAIVMIGSVAGFLIVRNMVYNSLDPRRKNPALLAFCTLLGPFLAIVLPFWVVLFLLGLISVWDLWAAKRGIIKKMVHLSDEHKREDRREERSKASEQAVGPTLAARSKRPVQRKGLISVKAGEDITTYGLYEGRYYSLGIGDFIFFSLLVSATMKWMLLKLPFADFYAPFWGEVLAVELTVLVALAVLYGLRQTLSYLDRETVMPGLPLSILWGTSALVSMSALLELWNLLLIGRAFNPF